ncbi:putative LOB domain-containing protein [Hibiscus syriacus]|uniref:RING-type E3 ubiquitin transferase n=1 Tax=Hibiscus syriacus TaxID=106335 RepID=A0A6A2ZBQ0_HIBSY|nr:putative LOB domain-containing protein [Hibiscus syriacus]
MHNYVINNPNSDSPKPTIYKPTSSSPPDRLPNSGPDCPNAARAGGLKPSLIHKTLKNSHTSELIVLNRKASICTRKEHFDNDKEDQVLTSLFEEIKETSSSTTTTTTQLPPSSVLCLTELFSVIRRVKLLMEGCKDGSSLWGLIQTETASNQFFVLVKEIGRALDILPLSLLNVTADIREQVELLHKQVKRVELFVDPSEVQQRDELLRLMAYNNDKNNRCPIDFKATKAGRYGGLMVVSNINNLLSLVSYSKSMVINEESAKDDIKQSSVSASRNIDQSSSSQSMLFNIPDEFRCPISLNWMKDPVIVASGHTYDRNSIAQWINNGHHTCPKSGQRLIHMALIPNYALKSLVHQWCQENNIPITECSSNVSESEINSKQKASEKTVDHISATKVAIDSVKMTAEFLVGKLAMGSLDIQRQAAYELSHALLNLSIFDNNKILIMAAGAIGNIVEVLELGKTMEARENAAAAIFSLSMIDDFKVAIGAHARAIPALIGLLREGTMTGKRDAATALSHLALQGTNKANIVVAGAVPLLIELLMDDKAGITDDALGVLTLLLSCPQGLEDIKKSRALVPLLIDLLRFGSAKGKENSITLLLGLCKDSGEEVARRL